jgi:GTP-binding protein HflX
MQITPPKNTEKVVLVHIDLSDNPNSNEDLNEFKELAVSSGANIVTIITGKRSAPNAKYFAGSGKVEEIKMAVLAEKANLVIFNHELSAAQERNLEKALQCRVIDRTALILDIFAARARTFEGKLQVELSQLQHLSAHLKRRWTHLERQRGGIGLRSGAGETQMEEDRRGIKQKILQIKKQLAKVRSQRQQGQKARKKAFVPTIAIIGYTNAGKSTLFNMLTKSNVYVADKLFATLDPTLRGIDIEGYGKIILADTVGFIRHLPHELVEAFRATLEETKDADLLLHVIDASDLNHKDKITAVNEVLEQIGANRVKQLLVYNKIDLLGENAPKTQIDYDPTKIPTRVWLSAISGEGISNLKLALQKILSGSLEKIALCLLPSGGKIRAHLYETNAVLKENIDARGNFHLLLNMRRNDLEKLFI